MISCLHCPEQCPQNPLAVDFKPLFLLVHLNSSFSLFLFSNQSPGIGDQPQYPQEQRLLRWGSVGRGTAWAENAGCSRPGCRTEEPVCPDIEAL